MVLAFLLARGDEEIVEALALVALPGGPHALQRGVAEHVETLAPESSVPSHGIQGHGIEQGMMAVVGVGEATLLGGNGNSRA